MDSFLYQIEHINETVIALPPQMAVSMRRSLSCSAYVPHVIAKDAMLAMYSCCQLLMKDIQLSHS